jgi:alpha-D-ribose 1-methylphosphonate 5-triphosphate synthase subunit PhnG
MNVCIPLFQMDAAIIDAVWMARRKGDTTMISTANPFDNALSNNTAPSAAYSAFTYFVLVKGEDEG